VRLDFETSSSRALMISLNDGAGGPMGAVSAVGGDPRGNSKLKEGMGGRGGKKFAKVDSEDNDDEDDDSISSATPA
jgi:hypothetical protein